jgi:hypothetical protein
MFDDEDKTLKVVPLVDLLEEAKKEEAPVDESTEAPTTDNVAMSPGVFRRFATWLFGQKKV